MRLLFAFSLLPLLLQAQQITVRVDSTASGWFFVRSTITTLPDSTKIVDETRKFFRTKSDIRNYIRDAYQTEIARDSTAISVASQSLARRKQERRALLQSLRAGGGSALRSSVAPPAVPTQPPNTSKKKKKQ